MDNFIIRPSPKDSGKDQTVVFKPPKKSFSLNTKAVAAVFVVMIVLVAGLIVGLGEVNKRQVVEKKAVTGPGMYNCGIRVNPVSEEKPTTANGGKYSTTYQIFYSGEGNTNTPEPRCDGPAEKTIVFEYWECVCPEPNGETGGICNKCQKRQETITLKKISNCAFRNSGDENAVTRTLSGSHPDGQVCGSFQMDVNVINCDGWNTYGPVFGIYVTGVECIFVPTPTPTSILTPTPTSISTPTPTSILTPTPTPTSILTVTPEVNPTSTPVPTITAGPTQPVTGIKTMTAGGILGGLLLFSLGLAIIF